MQAGNRHFKAGQEEGQSMEAGRQTAVCADWHRTGTKHAGRAWKSWNAGRKVGKPQKSLCMLAKCGRQAGRQKSQAGKHSKARTQADQKCRHCKAEC